MAKVSRAFLAVAATASLAVGPVAGAAAQSSPLDFLGSVGSSSGSTGAGETQTYEEAILRATSSQMHIRAGYQLDDSAEKSAVKVAQRARNGEFDTRYVLGMTLIQDGAAQARVIRIPLGSVESMNSFLSKRDISATSPRMLFNNAARSNESYVYFVEYYL